MGASAVRRNFKDLLDIRARHLTAADVETTDGAQGKADAAESAAKAASDPLGAAASAQSAAEAAAALRLRGGSDATMLSSAVVIDYQTGTRTIAAGSEVIKFTSQGDLLLGNNPFGISPQGSDSRYLGIGFLYAADKRRIYSSSLELSDVDPVDLAIGRARGIYPDGTPGQVLQGDPLGNVYWRGWTAEGGFNGRSAAIYARAADDITNAHSGGDLFIAVTPAGANSLVDAVRINHDGTLEALGQLKLDTTARFSGTTPQIFAWNAVSGSNGFLDLRLGTDTQSRFLLRQGGTMEWGAGTAATDLEWARQSTGIMRLRSIGPATALKLILQTAGTTLTGTVGAVNGSAALTGSGTAFLTELNEGVRVLIENTPGSGTFTEYIVASIQSDLSLTLTGTFAGASNTGLAAKSRMQAATHLLDFSDNNGNVVAHIAGSGSVRSSVGIGTKHEAAATPTAGLSGDIRIGTGKVWINDAGTWRYVPASGTIVGSDLVSATITDSQVAAANKDGAAGTASMRTLGAGAAQAAPGNDARFALITRELAHVQRTSGIAVTATTSAAATDLGLDSGTITYDGNPVILTFFTPQLGRGTSNINIVVYDGTTELGELGSMSAAPGSAKMIAKITPSAGSHNYKLKAYVDAGSGQVSAGDGSLHQLFPAFLRIEKAA